MLGTRTSNKEAQNREVPKTFHVLEMGPFTLAAAVAADSDNIPHRQCSGSDSGYPLQTYLTDSAVVAIVGIHCRLASQTVQW